MSELILGVKMFSRVAKLENLLTSAEAHPVTKTIVADGGRPSKEKTRVYNRDWDFDLEVLNLEYDVGLGAGRQAVVEALPANASYLMIMDPDQIIPSNIMYLVELLETDASLGGVSGLLFEPDSARISDETWEFHETDSGDTLVVEADPKAIETVGNRLFFPADIIPNASVLRKEVVEEYCWDPRFKIAKAHMDFYVGQWKNTDWEFGVCPEVLVKHYPGGDDSYMQQRRSREKIQNAINNFLDKWDYVRIEEGGEHTLDTNPELHEQRTFEHQ